MGWGSGSEGASHRTEQGRAEFLWLPKHTNGSRHWDDRRNVNPTQHSVITHLTAKFCDGVERDRALLVVVPYKPQPCTTNSIFRAAIAPCSMRLCTKTRALQIRTADAQK